MSFSADVKKELTAVLPDKICCRAAMAYGLAECGHAFSGAEISLQTELPEVAELYGYLLPRIGQTDKPAAGELQRRTRLYTRTFAAAADRQKLLETVRRDGSGNAGMLPVRYRMALPAAELRLHRRSWCGGYPLPAR